MKTRTEDEYATLIASLPSPDGLFKSKVPPLSRLKLEKRLAMLSPQHRAMLRLVENMLDWRLMSSSTPQSELILRRKKVFSGIKNRTLRRLIQERLEIRTFILALRMRELGKSAPSDGNWGFGRWQKHIVRHWLEPAFQLSNVFDWALKAEWLIREKKSFELEKLLLEISFRQLHRHSGNHQFDFEAVVIYVMKWNIVNRSTVYNSHVAESRFKHLMDELLPDPTTLFAQSDSTEAQNA